jgi:hypothetical protein
MLAKIAVLVNYYGCFEVVKLFTEMWITGLKITSPPRSYSRDTMLWIWISWVFREQEQFQAATKIALKESRAPVSSLGLPIPERIIGMWLLSSK